jgi:hypothetical protein
MSYAARAANDLGLAGWFGGSMASALTERRSRLAGLRIWDVATIAVHMAGAIGLTVMNRRRIGAQRGVARLAILKGVLTGLALAATMLAEARRSAPDGAQDPTAVRPDGVARWLPPVLTGATLLVNSAMGEQQRPAEVSRGIAGRIAGVADHLTPDHLLPERAERLLGRDRAA